MLVMSLWFYGYFEPKYLILIGSSIIVNYSFSKKLAIDAKYRKLLLIVAVVFNLCLIFIFKYYDFFIKNINWILKKEYNLQNILLPLGISFFTFQQLSYIVDSYYGKTKEYLFLDYALYITFFPQLVAGPIVLHHELIPQFGDEECHKVNFENLSKGIMMFTMGLSKKLLIADTFGRVVTWGYSNLVSATSGDLILVMLSYTFQIYFDFSGYSDMAAGIAAMFNIAIPVNFNSPYKSYSIIEFWQRWHITLNRFLRTYIYFPLGGSRKGTARTYFNILIVFLASGIWHGANVTFILWGVLHGLANVFTRAFHKQFEGWHQAMKWLVTFLFLNLTWLLFRSDSVSQWVFIMKRMCKLSDLNLSSELKTLFTLPEVLQNLLHLTYYENAVNGFSMFLFSGFSLWVCLNCRNSNEYIYKRNGLTLTFTIVMLVICILSLGNVSVFLYFNF